MTELKRQPPASLLNRRRARLLVLLFVLFSSVYLIFYSARIDSVDSDRMVNAVRSFADHGDFYLDLSAWQFPSQEYGNTIVYPLQVVDAEPLQVILAVPLYVLARVVPGIGLVQTVYLFNVLIVAAAGCVLFVYGLALGYGETTALLAALAFGLTTAIVPYAKTFFREPLMLLALLICALLIERLRARGYRSLPLLIGVGIAAAALPLAKASSLLALPALVVIALPDLHSLLTRRVLIALAGIAALALVAFALLDAAAVFGNRYDLTHLLTPDSAAYFTTALQAYLLSVGGSLWGTSPILLLALPGMIVLARRGHWRYPLAILLLIGAFALGYAALNGRNWFGGVSWPPRFLIPVLPFVMLGALPIFERMAKARVWAILGAALAIYGLWVQISGVTLDWAVYASHLPSEAGGLFEWGGGLNDLRYLRWVITPALWGAIPLDIGWTIIGAPGIMLAFALVALGAGVALVRALRGAASRLMVVPPLALIVIVGVGLHLLYDHDPRYLSGDDTLAAMLPILRADTTSSDVVLLSSPRYEPFFANAGKLLGAGRVITLELQPGETPSPQAQPLVRSDDPDALLTKETIQLIYDLAATRDRLWLLVNGGPDLAWDVRPVERFMDAHYYPIQTIQTGPITRLIEYSTISAPNTFAYRGPDQLSDLAFGDHIRLEGYDLPGGTDYQPGSALALSTYWTTDAPLTADYTIGLYLRDSNGAAVAQDDSQPGGGFFPTNQWQPGVPVWDNRAIRLPADLPPGDYQLWVKLYDFGADGALRDLPLSAGQKIDDSIGVLPVTIHVG